MNLSKLFVAVSLAVLVLFTPVVSGIYSTATGVVTIVNPPGDDTQAENASSSPAPQFNAFIGKAEADGPLGWANDRLSGWSYVGTYVQIEYQQAAGNWNNVVNYVQDPYIGYSPHMDY